MATQIPGTQADLSSTTFVKPKASASVLLIRDGIDGLEVFMLKRSEKLSFSPGFWVFPGGAVDPSDYPSAEQDNTDPIHAFKSAAIRETFEESRFLLGEGPVATLIDSISWPGDLPDDEEFFPWLEKRGVTPNFSALKYLACWTAPKQIKKRFMTRFFIALAPPEQEGCHDGGETVESKWFKLGDLISAIDEGSFKLMFPTEMNNRWLNQYKSTKEVLDAMEAHQPPDVTPRLEKREDGMWLNIPIEAGYGISEKFVQP